MKSEPRGIRQAIIEADEAGLIKPYQNATKESFNEHMNQQLAEWRNPQPDRDSELMFSLQKKGKSYLVPSSQYLKFISE